MAIATLSPISGPAEALRRLAQDHDADAWAWLFAELGPRLRALSARLSEDAHSAEDALQETLLTLRDHAGSFQPRLEPDADALHWILRVAANTALELRRRRRRTRRRDASAAPASGGGAPDADRLAQQEVQGILRDAIAELNEAERTAIVLRVLEGIDYHAIAAALGCAEGTVKSHVSRGLQRLRRRLRHRELSGALLGALLTPAAMAQGGTAATVASAASLLQSLRVPQVICIPAKLPAISLATKLAVGVAGLLAITASGVLVGGVHLVPTRSALVAASASVSPQSMASEQDLASPPLLVRPISFAFDQTNVSEVLHFLSQITGSEPEIDPTVLAQVKTVTLKADRMRIDQVLRLVFHRSHIRIIQHGTVIQVHRIPDGSAMTDDEALVEHPLSQAPASVRDQLAQQVHVEFAMTAAGDGVTFLQRITNLNVIMDPAIDVSGLPALTLSLDHVQLTAVLDEICRQDGLTACWECGAVFLSRTHVASATRSPMIPVLAPHLHERL